MLDFLDQFRRLNTERLRQFLQYKNCRVSGTSLEVADICPVDPGFEGILFLRPAFGGAQALEVRCENLTNIHARDVARMSTINLQTISDI